MARPVKLHAHLKGLSHFHARHMHGKPDWILEDKMKKYAIVLAALAVPAGNS